MHRRNSAKWMVRLLYRTGYAHNSEAAESAVEAANRAIDSLTPWEGSVTGGSNEGGGPVTRDAAFDLIAQWYRVYGTKHG